MGITLNRAVSNAGFGIIPQGRSHAHQGVRTIKIQQPKVDSVQREQNFYLLVITINYRFMCPNLKPCSDGMSDMRSHSQNQIPIES